MGCSAAVLPVLLPVLSRTPSLKLVIVWGLGAARLPELPAGATARLVTLDQVG